MKWIEEFDYALRALVGVNNAHRENPAQAYPHDADMDDMARRHAPYRRDGAARRVRQRR